MSRPRPNERSLSPARLDLPPPAKTSLSLFFSLPLCAVSFVRSTVNTIRNIYAVVILYAFWNDVVTRLLPCLSYVSMASGKFTALLATDCSVAQSVKSKQRRTIVYTNECTIMKLMTLIDAWMKHTWFIARMPHFVNFPRGDFRREIRESAKR